MPRTEINRDQEMDMKIKLTDRCFAAGCTVLGGHLQETIGVDFEGRNKLSLTTKHRWNAGEFKFAEQTIVAALRAFTLIPERLTNESSAVNLQRRRPYTGNVTVVWLSSTVVKVRDLFVGMGVFRGTTTPNTSPCMATPRERGATSRRSRS
jgi:hypothetical protein